MTYDLNSEFDIEQHKQTFINYLEILIEADGHVVYAVPSHIEKAVALACEALHVSRPELEAMCLNAKRAAQRFDFRNLTKELMEILEKE